MERFIAGWLGPAINTALRDSSICACLPACLVCLLLLIRIQVHKTASASNHKHSYLAEAYLQNTTYHLASDTMVYAIKRTDTKFITHKLPRPPPEEKKLHDILPASRAPAPSHHPNKK